MSGNSLLGRWSRRDLLRRSHLGFGWLAFLGLTQQAHAREASVRTHFTPRAKRVIFLFMDGGVSHVDTFDPKPELSRRHGQPAVWHADPLSQATSAGRRWLGSPWQFRRHGHSGLPVSDLFPRTARVADDLCVIRSLVGES